jgi:phosphoribosylamine--glycine ligase
MTDIPSDLKILIVGSGGREHALAWALKRSPHTGTLWIAPGNAGTAQLGTNVNIPADNLPALVEYARETGVDLVIVGPEVPLALGLVDALTDAGIRAFGPSEKAAQLEASKRFAKDFMADHNIPTARYAAFSEHSRAVEYVDRIDGPMVIKADGLAAGKGVIVCETAAEAREALTRMMLDDAFAGAGTHVVIEERLTGKEVSLMAFSDGTHVSVLPPARDHKRIFDQDQGENTGGMGAYTYPPDVSPELIAQITRDVIQPTVDGMRARGTPFVGVLYPGLMLTPDGPKVLEFNARFGDPETQALLPLLETDLVEVIFACLDGTLDRLDVRWKPGTCATIVAAAPGYPGKYPRGAAISGVDAVSDAVVFHAGTALRDGQLVTSGGRVLAVSAVGATLDDAIGRAYDGIAQISFNGIHYRRDIGR